MKKRNRRYTAEQDKAVKQRKPRGIMNFLSLDFLGDIVATIINALLGN